MSRNHVFSDPINLLITFCLFISATIVGFHIARQAYLDDSLFGVIYMGGLAIILDVLLLIFTFPKVFVQIKFTDKGIYICKLYKKKNFIPYRELKITNATYNHMGYCPTYIVFSTRTLSKYESTHINLVEQKDIVKVLKSKKVVHLVKKYTDKDI